MRAQSDDYTAETRYLRRCINDLLSVLTLPALWSGYEPLRIVETLADTLVSMLELDFVYVRLHESYGEKSIEIVRVLHSAQHTPSPQEIADLFRGCTAESENTAQRISNPVGDGEIGVIVLQLGLRGEIGFMVAGSQRTNFAEETERLVLSVATNQTSVGLHEARLMLEQKRLAGELDRRVALRTAELAAINEQLRKEVLERKKIEERLRRSEAFLAEGQYLSRTGSFAWRVETDEITWSEQLYRIFEVEPGTLVTLDLIGNRVHPEDAQVLREMIEQVRAGVSYLEFEHRLLLPDHTVKYLHLIAHLTSAQEEQLEYIGAVQDVTQRRVSEEALATARSELAKVARMTSLGVLTAAMAHEVNQPLSGIMTNASTCLRMLSADPPNVEGARETARRTIRDGNRASDVISRLRTLYSKKDPSLEVMDLNDATREVVSLSLSELQRNRIILRQELAEDLPLVNGDRVQLQQVILNLLRNAADAIGNVNDRPRDLLITTERDPENLVRLSVKDAGTGFEPQAADRLFRAFYTTKDDGMGIGLSISRSIIEAHQGRLWATPNDGHGATFSFVIPRRPEGSAGTDAHDEISPATDAA
jgi:signal transduction histidine kinase